MRPVGSEEIGKWLNLLLDRNGLGARGRKRTPHSFKATLLSYLAKAGVSLSDREMLGGHTSHVKSVITYSRDAGGPIWVLESMLSDIRASSFRPDESRSGRFLKKVKREPLETMDGQNDVPDSVVDSSSSDDTSGQTSSSSDERGTEDSKCSRLVKSPTPPEGTSLIQHEKSNCVHLLQTGCEHSLLCLWQDHFIEVPT